MSERPEAFPEAAEILRAAGWKPHDTWGVYTHGTLVMGSPRAGDFHVKNTARCADSPDTPDDPVLAAHWLVARFPVAEAGEPEETPAHEDDEETGTEDGAEASGAPEWFASVDGDSTPAQEAGDDLSEDLFRDQPDAGSNDLGAEILDADFTEPTDPPPEDHPSGAFIFGDNLPQMRTSAIGLVVQISLAKQEAIWTEAGAGPDEYSQLMSAVVRDTVDGTYKGDQATYDRFVALSTYDNAARRVQVYERDLVNMLTTADRETIETFDPAAGWPA